MDIPIGAQDAYLGTHPAGGSALRSMMIVTVAPWVGLTGVALVIMLCGDGALPGAVGIVGSVTGLFFPLVRSHDGVVAVWW